MKLSNREWMIYDAIVSEDRSWSAEDVAELIWSDDPRPKSWRSRVNETMRMLCAKTQAIGMSPYVARTSSLGPGRKAEYACFVGGRR